MVWNDQLVPVGVGELHGMLRRRAAVCNLRLDDARLSEEQVDEAAVRADRLAIR